MANEFVQTMADARVDAQSLSEFVFKPAGFMVTRRLASPIPTLSFYLNRFDSINSSYTDSITTIQAAVIDAENLIETNATNAKIAVDEAIINSGFITIDSFELGATITQRNQALRHTADGKLYRWAGDLPKAVPSNSTPTSTGGFGSNAWLEVSDVTLRQDLANPDMGAAMVAHMPAGAGAIPTDVEEELRRRVTPYDFGAVDGQDASDALDKFASFVLLNPSLLYDVTGDFKISRPWLFYFQGVKAIHWNLRLTTTAPMQCALSLEGTRVEHTGKIEIRGQGSVTNWATFTLDYGVVVSGCQGSTLPYISAFKCRFYGTIYNEEGSLGIPLRAGQKYKNNTTITIDTIQGADCGGYNTGYGEDGSGTLNNLGFVANFSNQVRTGSAGVPSQRTTIDVDILPPVAASSTPIFAAINDKVFRIYASSGTSGGGSITIYPWMPLSWEAGEVKYIFGGAFGNVGPNGGPTKVGRVDSVRCAISVHDFALYGATVLQNIAQFCSIGLVLGSVSDGIGPSNSATKSIYTEGVFRNVVQIGEGSSHITNRYGEFYGDAYINCEKIQHQGASGDSLLYYTGFNRVFMPSSITSLSLAGVYSKRPGNFTDGSLSLDANSCIDIVVHRNSWTVNIEDVTNENKNTGLDFATIKAIGNNNRGAPTGSFTFNAPLGWTVNGVESTEFSNFYEVAEFLVSWDFSEKNVRVNCISRRGASAEPTTGDWMRGDIVYNTTPVEGGVAGWRCTTPGTPGVWIPFGGLRGLSAYSPTNVTTDRAFDADTVVVDELADVVGTLIADLKASGVLK